MKPESCLGCPLQHVGEGYVYGEGPDDAKVLLLGEALGAEEALRGRPFIGGAGRNLNRFLRKAGITRSELYITNIVRCRPPKNRTPTPLEMSECMNRYKLLDFLPKFNLVVLMGNTALSAICNRTRITKWRGSVFTQTLPDGSVIKVLPTLHPAAIMRQQDMIPVIISDFVKIANECMSPDWMEPKQDYILDAGAKEIHDLWTAQKPIAFDVETNGLTPTWRSITLLGISNEPGKVFVIKKLYDPLVKKELVKLFLSDILKIGHNIMFDISHMEAQNIPVTEPYFDTMLAHHMVLSDVPNDLGFVSSLYTRIPYWKHTMRQKLDWYNACDVDATFQLYQELSYRVTSTQMDRPYQTSIDLMRPLHKMKVRGIRYDTKRALKWSIGLNVRIRQLEAILAKGVNSPGFNWRSAKQLGELLYDKYGLPEQKNRRTGTRTTSADALEKLHELTGSKIVETILKLRKLGKLASTYFNPPDSKDDRVHCSYLIHGTGTGRLSSVHPNLQNVPKGPARDIYIADEGCIFVSADYSQVELRIAALLAGEKSLVEAFEAGVDIHKKTAADVYNKKVEDITDKERFLAKTIVYGLGYGRGAVSLAAAYGLSHIAAKRFIDDYFKSYPAIKQWRQDILAKASRDGFLANPFGRRRYFFGPNIAPKVYNFLPQSTAGDIISEATVKLDRELPGHAHLMLTIHDELVAQCEKGKEKEVIECMKKIMEAPIDVLDGYSFPVETSIGETWQEVS